MKAILEELYAGREFTREEAYAIMNLIISGEVPDIQIGGFLSALNMRQLLAEEIKGFRDALLENCRPVTLDRPVIDLCGTGGDGKDTFNISTLASFVVAGAGYAVAKHGNYGVSSTCGSSNVLEHLGARFTPDTALLQKQVEKAGICFMHAPLFHPAMKNVAPARRALGVKTVFNILGPLVNPAKPEFQVSGVFRPDILPIYDKVLGSACKRYAAIYSLDGFDEISLTGKFVIASNGSTEYMDPIVLGFPVYRPDQIKGGSTVEEAANIFLSILEGRSTRAQNDVVVANAALAIQIAGDLKWEEAVTRARESLASGEALNSLKMFLDLQK